MLASLGDPADSCGALFVRKPNKQFLGPVLITTAIFGMEKSALPIPEPTFKDVVIAFILSTIVIGASEWIMENWYGALLFIISVGEWIRKSLVKYLSLLWSLTVGKGQRVNEARVEEAAELDTPVDDFDTPYDLFGSNLKAEPQLKPSVDRANTLVQDVPE
jgi:hypothetical protein